MSACFSSWVFQPALFFSFFKKYPAARKLLAAALTGLPPERLLSAVWYPGKPLRKRLLPSGTNRFRRVLSPGDHPVLFPLCFFCFSSSFFLSTARFSGKISPYLSSFSGTGSEKSFFLWKFHLFRSIPFLPQSESFRSPARTARFSRSLCFFALSSGPPGF